MNKLIVIMALLVSACSVTQEPLKEYRLTAFTKDFRQKWDSAIATRCLKSDSAKHAWTIFKCPCNCAHFCRNCNYKIIVNCP
jgi:hypothetical protein